MVLHVRMVYAPDHCCAVVRNTRRWGFVLVGGPRFAMAARPLSSPVRSHTPLPSASRARCRSEGQESHQFRSHPPVPPYTHSRPTQGRSPVLVHGGTGQTRPRLSVLGAQCRSPLGYDSRQPNRAQPRSYMAGHMPHIRLHILSNMTGYSVDVMASPIAVLAGLEDDVPGAVLGVRCRIHQRNRHAADCTLRDEGNLRSGMNVVALIRKGLCSNSASKDRGDAQLVGLQLRCIIPYDTHLFAGALPLQNFAQVFRGGQDPQDLRGVLRARLLRA